MVGDAAARPGTGGAGRSGAGILSVRRRAWWRLLRRDLRPSQRAALALELPEYRAAKEKAAERERSGQFREDRQPGTASVSVRKPSEPPVHAATVAAQFAGVSTSYVEKAVDTGNRRA